MDGYPCWPGTSDGSVSPGHTGNHAGGIIKECVRRGEADQKTTMSSGEAHFITRFAVDVGEVKK